MQRKIRVLVGKPGLDPGTEHLRAISLRLRFDDAAEGVEVAEFEPPEE